MQIKAKIVEKYIIRAIIPKVTIYQGSSLASFATLAGQPSDNLALATALDSKAPLNHTHAISDVNGLVVELASKADDADLANLSNTLSQEIEGKADAVHSHTIAQVDNLGVALHELETNNEATTTTLVTHASDTNNPHGVTKTQVGLGNVDNTSDVNKPVSTDTQTALNAKADLTHTHSINQVTNLQSELDGKALTVHTHSINAVTNLQTELNAKAPTVHTHSIANITNLQSELDAKASATHTHSISQVTGLQTSLDAKVNLTTLLNNGAGLAIHGSNASFARPTGFAQVIWIGTVQPTNGINSDILIKPAT